MLHLTHPPASREVRAERPDRVETWLERQVHRVHGRLQGLAPRGWVRRGAEAVNAAGPRFAGMAGRGLAAEAGGLRERLLADGFLPEHVADCFAWSGAGLPHPRHAPSRQPGHGRPVMLRGMSPRWRRARARPDRHPHGGHGGLAGLPVHIISVNDYLTGRDAENWGPCTAPWA